MQTVSESLDSSFAHLAFAPSFSAVSVAPAGQSFEQEFIASMERKFLAHKADMEAWMQAGLIEAKNAETILRVTETPLDEPMVRRFLKLSGVISERAEETAKRRAKVIKDISKQSKRFAKLSPKAHTYMEKLIPQIEKVSQAEIDSLVDMSDHYRGLARAYDPRNGRSEVFADAENAISFLRAEWKVEG